MATYWREDPGQIGQNEVVDSGYRTREEAEEARVKLGRGRVEYLLVHESEAPIENAAYRPVRSVRFCLIVDR